MSFDSLYVESRDGLLLQTYALTGDRDLAERSVREAFVRARHHWARVTREDDPVSWVRQQAWSLARRGRPAREQQPVAPAAAAATLGALATLSRDQRALIVLDALAGGTRADAARETGRPLAEAERSLAAATGQVATALEIEPTQVPGRIRALGDHLEPTRWPRPWVLERGGRKRRRTHTAVGVIAALAALVGAGFLVADPDGSGTPALADRAEEEPTVSAAPEEPELPGVGADHLLGVSQVARLAPDRDWSALPVTNRTGGDGVTFPCLPAETGESGAEGLLVAKFATATAPKKPVVAAAEAIQVGRSEAAAKRLYTRVRAVYAGCPDPRTQLLGAHRVDGVGDDAMLMVLRSWRTPKPVKGTQPADVPRTTVVGLARTGQVTTYTVAQVGSAEPARLGPAAAMLAATVNSLCGAPGTATCAAPPTTRRIPAPVVRPDPALLTVVDLPPVPGVRRPWTGTGGTRPNGGETATACDTTDFAGLGRARTRTFLITDADLPDRFGLSQSVAALPLPKAKAFAAETRDQLASCEKDNLAAEVTPLQTRTEGPVEIASWRIDVELPDDRTARYVMGVVRNGTAVAQVTFTPGPDTDVADEVFAALLDRAAERLTYLPAPQPVETPAQP